MRPGRTLALALCLMALQGCVNQGGAAKLPPEKSKDQAMQIEDIPYLPFGLTKDSDLDGIRIRLAFISAKTGAGKQEIVLTGKGHVSLFFSRSFQDKAPKIIEGDCDPERILRLLDLMEGNGFFGLPDKIEGQDKGASQRVLEVVLPDRSKTLLVQETGLYTVEQMIGAVKLAAAQCVPEALNHRLFPNL